MVPCLCYYSLHRYIDTQIHRYADGPVAVTSRRATRVKIGTPDWKKVKSRCND
jgi:hypothetical protein